MQTESTKAAPWEAPGAPVAVLSGLRAALQTHAIWVALILGVAFALRLAWIAVSDWQPIPGDDAFRYDFTARALADGQGYVQLNGAVTAFWPPGYPLLLAAVYAVFGEGVLAAQLLNALLATATVGLVYLIGRRTVGAQAGLIAAAIVACFPSLIFFTAVTLSETAFTFLSLLGVYLLIVEAQRERPRDLRLLLAVGLVLGFASLVRGPALLLPLVAIPFWLRSGSTWPAIGGKLVAIALGIGLIVAPWTVRNAIEMESPVLISTNAGVDFWIGHHEGASGSFGVAGGDELIARYPELDSVAREVRVNAEGFRDGVAYAVTHPAQELVLPFKKFFWLYYNDEEGLKWNEGHGGQPFLGGPTRQGLLALSNVYYFLVLGLLLLSVPFWRSQKQPGRILLVSLLAYWTLVHLVFFGDPRFHAPIMPVVALLAALPWEAIRSRLRHEPPP